MNFSYVKLAVAALMMCLLIHCAEFQADLVKAQMGAYSSIFGRTAFGNPWIYGGLGTANMSSYNALIGLTSSNYLAQWRAAQATQGSGGTAYLDHANDVNKHANDYSRNLESKIADLQRQINEAKADGDKKRLQQVEAEAKSKKAEVAKSVDALKTEIKVQEKNIAAQDPGKGARGIPERKAVAELNNTKTTLNQLQTQLDALERGTTANTVQTQPPAAKTSSFATPQPGDKIIKFE